jgi:AcrR family transcriptional regulator
MADICRSAAASIGSVYHHFQSKEQLAAELYLQGIDRVQQASLAALSHESSAAREGIRSLVLSYLTWVEENPEFARFLLTERHAEFLTLAEAKLSTTNREFRDAVRGHLAEHVRAGALPELSPEVYSALLVGPAEYLSRQWLAGRVHGSLAQAKQQLADAVWHALSP